MSTFLFICITASFFNLFIIVYTFTLPYYPEHLRNKWNQETFVGLFNLFINLIVCVLWVLYFYFYIFYNFSDTSDTFNFFLQNDINNNDTSRLNNDPI